MKKLFNNKKGNLTLYVVFLISAVTVLVIGALLAPMGVLFNTEMYLAGEDILNKSIDKMQGINDSEIRTAVLSVTNSAKASAQTNIEINANIFQYSWIFILVITAIVITLISRNLVEIRSGGGGFT